MIIVRYKKRGTQKMITETFNEFKKQREVFGNGVDK